MDDAEPTLAAPPIEPGCVRILLGLDVPQSALAEIEIDWALVDALQHEEPALGWRITRIALARLLKQTVSVSGAAIQEPMAEGLARWARRAA